MDVIDNINIKYNEVLQDIIDGVHKADSVEYAIRNYKNNKENSLVFSYTWNYFFNIDYFVNKKLITEKCSSTVKSIVSSNSILKLLINPCSDRLKVYIRSNDKSILQHDHTKELVGFGWTIALNGDIIEEKIYYNDTVTGSFVYESTSGIKNTYTIGDNMFFDLTKFPLLNSPVFKINYGSFLRSTNNANYVSFDIVHNT